MLPANDNAPLRANSDLRDVTLTHVRAWTVECGLCGCVMRGPALVAGKPQWRCCCGHGVAVESRGAA